MGEGKPLPLGEVAAQPTERDTERVIESPSHHPLTTLSPDFVGSSPRGRALVGEMALNDKKREPGGCLVLSFLQAIQISTRKPEIITDLTVDIG